MDTHKEQIISTLQNVFTSADRRDWQKCRGSFVEKTFVDFSSLNGVPGAVISADELIKNWEGFLPRFKSTQHMVTNFEIEIHGEKADANFYGHAIHYLPHSKGGDLWGVYGVYTAVLTDTSAGWKISSITLKLKYQEGNKALPSIVVNCL